MALKSTIKKMHQLLEEITIDLHKAEGGNKAASQRVRTGTIALEKLAKQYRKESIANEKTAKKPAAKRKTAKKAPAKKAVKAKAKPKRATAKKKMTVKKKTAKSTTRRRARA